LNNHEYNHIIRFSNKVVQPFGRLEMLAKFIILLPLWAFLGFVVGDIIKTLRK